MMLSEQVCCETLVVDGFSIRLVGGIHFQILSDFDLKKQEDMKMNTAYAINDIHKDALKKTWEIKNYPIYSTVTPSG